MWPLANPDRLGLPLFPPAERQQDEPEREESARGKDEDHPGLEPAAEQADSEHGTVPENLPECAHHQQRDHEPRTGADCVEQRPSDRSLRGKRLLPAEVATALMEPERHIVRSAEEMRAWHEENKGFSPC